MKNKIKLFIASMLVGVLIMGPDFLSAHLKSYASDTVYIVDSSTDAPDSATTYCTSHTVGQCTLRQAIREALLVAEEDVTINFSVSTVTLEDLSGDSGVEDLRTLSQTTRAITIDGGSTGVTIINGGQYTQLFQIGSTSANSTNNIIKNLTITDFDNGIVIYGDNNRVENVTMTGHLNALSGECEGKVGITVTPRTVVVAEADGSFKQPASGNTLVNNTISCFRKGMLLQKMDHMTVSRNNLYNNTANSDVDFAADKSPCHVTGIDIQGTKHIALDSDSNNFITDNVLNNNGLAFDPGPRDCSEVEFAAGGIILSAFDTTTQAEKVTLSHNRISSNTYFGLALINSSYNVINSNQIYQNGTVANTDPSLATDDIGSGILLGCFPPSTLGSSGNAIMENDIHNNADDGVIVNAACVDNDIPMLGNDTNNPIFGNSIYQNGRIGTGSGMTVDDGIGINLVANDVVAAGYSPHNSSISRSDSGDVDIGGNNVQNAPVIDSATFDDTTGEWTISGLVDTASGAIIELYQVDCAGNAQTFSVTLCDADSDVDGDYGYGEGHRYMGHTALSMGHSDNTWTITIPASAGFNGGLLTATLTTIEGPGGACQNIYSLPNRQFWDDLGIGSVGVCNTSEFGVNYLVQNEVPSVAHAIINNLATLPTVDQGGRQRYLITLTNDGNQTFTDIRVNNSLPAELTYVSGSCYWSENVLPDTTGLSNCSLVDPAIIFSGFSASFAPAETIYIIFSADVSATADLSSITTVATVATGGLTTPTPTSAIEPAYTQFTVTEASGGSSTACNASGDVVPTAVFSINGTTVSGDTYTAPAGNATFVSSGTGNAPVTYNWVFDGGTLAAHTSSITQSLVAGTHTMTSIVSDCDGQIAVRSVVITVNGTSPSAVTALTLAKVLAPASGLHSGDVVTVDITVNNPSTSNAISTLALRDHLDGLSSSVPSCSFAIDATPGPTASPCTVTADGNIILTLPSGGLLPGHRLQIRYQAIAAGNAGSYTNSLSYTSSTPTTAVSPSVVSATHAMISSTTACTGSATVDAELSVNGDPTPTSTYAGTSAGLYTFTNVSTAGDDPVVYHWFVNNQLQSETTNSIVRLLSAPTAVTLFKQDCNGSNDSDAVTVSLPDAPSPAIPPVSPVAGPFTVVKAIVDGKSVHSLSDQHIGYQVTVTNTDSVAHTYDLVDIIPAAFESSVVMDDAAGGTDASTGRQIVVNNIALNAHQAKVIRYTLTLVNKSVFPLDSYDLDSGANKKDADFYADAVESADVNATNNLHKKANDIAGHPDSKFVSLGNGGTIVVDVGNEKVITNGSGDDFALFQVNNSIDDHDQSSESVDVSVSQDGENFTSISGDGSYDISRSRLNWIRYIKIEDTSSPVLANAPGVDIDAVCLLHVGVPIENTALVTSVAITNASTQTSYLDVTSAFDHPLKKSDCTEPEQLVQKDARTLELLPVSPPTITPSPVVPHVPAPQLPKTGAEVEVIALLAPVSTYLLWRYRNRKQK